LLAKLKEKWVGNQQVKLILVEPRKEHPRVSVITRGGIVTGEDRVTPENTIEGLRIRRVAKKTQLFDPRNEKNMFKEARREFG
jgi:hypothetical protein